MRFQLALSTLLLALPAAGCSGNVGQAGCEDAVRTIGDVAVRCGFDRQANEAVFEANATAGRGCEGVVGLRDEEAFYEECLPSIESLTCAEFDDPEYVTPASCSMQLNVRR